MYDPENRISCDYQKRRHRHPSPLICSPLFPTIAIKTPFYLTTPIKRTSPMSDKASDFETFWREAINVFNQESGVNPNNIGLPELRNQSVVQFLDRVQHHKEFSTHTENIWHFLAGFLGPAHTIYDIVRGGVATISRLLRECRLCNIRLTYFRLEWVDLSTRTSYIRGRWLYDWYSSNICFLFESHSCLCLNTKLT